MKSRGLIIIVAAFVAAVAGGAIWYAHARKATIDSYEACAKAGNPIQLSYPSVCRADGKSFVNPSETAPAPPN